MVQEKLNTSDVETRLVVVVNKQQKLQPEEHFDDTCSTFKEEDNDGDNSSSSLKSENQDKTFAVTTDTATSTTNMKTISSNTQDDEDNKNKTGKSPPGNKIANDKKEEQEDDDNNSEKLIFHPPIPIPFRQKTQSSSSLVSGKSVRFLECTKESNDGSSGGGGSGGGHKTIQEERTEVVDIERSDKTANHNTTHTVSSPPITTVTRSSSKSIIRQFSSIGSSIGDHIDNGDGGDPYICHPTDVLVQRKDGSTGNISTLSTRVSQNIDDISTRAFHKLFGDSYSKRECGFVLLAGALIAFNIGFVNGSCVSGFLTPTQTQSVSGFTSSFTRSAMALADGDYETYGYHVCLILSYMFGSCLCGFITPHATPYQIEPTYGPTFMIGGIMLLIASFFAASEVNPNYIFYLTAGANGIQNGIASLYSANLIRCSLTGSSTDIALVLAQCLRGNYAKLWKGLVLLSIIGNFWLGGFLSFYFSRRFLTFSLFFNATLFWIIGLGLVYFLVSELQISVRAAILGTWEWKKALDSLSQSIHYLQYSNDNGSSGDGGTSAGDHDRLDLEESKLYRMFDIIDHDGNGEIDSEELLDALLQANVKINAKGVMVLIKSADVNGDGMINRKEWSEIVRKIESSS